MTEEKYVSRGGLKLASVAEVLKLNFNGKSVLDVGSSTGGFTDFALQHGAAKVIAVDSGTNQLHPSLRADSRVELHEKTDIRRINLNEVPDIVVIDVSFVSLRQILPAIADLSGPDTEIIAMVKPQFEAASAQSNRGVIKNDTIRRQILKDFEKWARGRFVIVGKADSQISGAKGNQERFYNLKITS
ncbi:MAG TPA: TlyA family RNA methyltransferase [Candidatus Binatia bacterium]|nr:TlyA family RNA methyltransferase [Candidatus Binatia bacterium]